MGGFCGQVQAALSMYIIGLTGGLKTGKTTVAQMFRLLGARVIDADKIVHESLSVRGACVKSIKAKFGEGVLTRGGSVNRKALAEIVFQDKRKLEDLEKIIHPHVRRVIRERLSEFKKSHPQDVVVLDVPLLFESGLDRLADLTITVKASQSLQIERAMRDLGISRTQALKRIRQQMPMTEKVKRSDVVIDNRSSKSETQKKVKQIWLKHLPNPRQ